MMVEEFKEEAFLTQLKQLLPIVDNLRLMLGAARHAFNRHSQAKIEEINSLLDDITLDLDPFFVKVEQDLEQIQGGDKTYLLKLQVVISQMELMAHKIASLSEPIHLKANRGAVLADKDFLHINDLFSQETGLMRGLADIFEINDASLKAYVLQTSEKIQKSCHLSEIEHESRMMDSPGQAGTWSIYIDMLNRFRDILGHLINIVKGLD